MDAQPEPTEQIPASQAVLYAMPEITARGKFSRSFVYKLMARGEFPQPVLRSGPRFTRWGPEVDAYFADPSAWIAANTKLAVAQAE